MTREDYNRQRVFFERVAGAFFLELVNPGSTLQVGDTSPHLIQSSASLSDNTRHRQEVADIRKARGRLILVSRMQHRGQVIVPARRRSTTFCPKAPAQGEENFVAIVNGSGLSLPPARVNQEWKLFQSLENVTAHIKRNGSEGGEIWPVNASGIGGFLVPLGLQTPPDGYLFQAGGKSGCICLKGTGQIGEKNACKRETRREVEIEAGTLGLQMSPDGYLFQTGGKSCALWLTGPVRSKDNLITTASSNGWRVMLRCRHLFQRSAKSGSKILRRQTGQIAGIKLYKGEPGRL